MLSTSTQHRPLVKLALVATLAAAGLILTAPGHAASATAQASGTVVAPILIAAAADLAFGTFSPGAGGGTITVNTGGGRAATGVQLLASGTPAAARFDITGQPGSTYGISYGGTPVLTRAGGTETMALTRIADLTGANGTAGEVASGTLSAGGTQSVYVGGTLVVAANQAPGIYNGNVSVTVDYN